MLSLYRSIITGLTTADLRAGLVSLSEAGGMLAATVTPISMDGVIAVATPIIGLGPAIQLVGIGVTIIGMSGSIVCLLVTNSSPPVSAERTESVGD